MANKTITAGKGGERYVPYEERTGGESMDNRIIKDFPGTKPDATNNMKIRLPMYLGYAVAMIVSFFMPIATLIIILVMVAAMTVGIFRMMHADKK